MEGLTDGYDMEGLEDESAAVRPITTKAQFKKELKGSVKNLQIDPLEVNKIWDA
jgi:hypothetical protein